MAWPTPYIFYWKLSHRPWWSGDGQRGSISLYGLSYSNGRYSSSLSISPNMKLRSVSCLIPPIATFTPTHLQTLPSPKWLLMIFYHTHRPVPYPVIIGEIYSGIRWEQMQRPTDRHYMEKLYLGALLRIPTLPRCYRAHGIPRKWRVTRDRTL